jgi:hypothetical protein
MSGRSRTGLPALPAYDDFCPDGRPDVSGTASDGNPQRLTVTVA